MQRDENGEVLKLGPPASGELTIKVDPAAVSAPFAAGTQTLLPGSAIHDRRHLDQDLTLFVYKGQGRITVNERSLAVAPGIMLHVPRGTWYAARNTGTGLFQIAWVGSPGIELFFRDLSGLGSSPSEQALQEVAQRHHVEFRAPAVLPAPAGSRPHRHQRGRRGGGRPRMQPAPSSTVVPPVIGAAPISSAPAATPHRHRDRGPRRRRGGAGLRRPPAAPGIKPLPSVKAPQSSQRSGRPPQRSRNPRKVKEVYMGGQWIKVEGDGPAIAPSRKRLDPNRNRDDDTPPLSFTL
jgi:quercetin dioxygenase-like cupin family protein